MAYKKHNFVDGQVLFAKDMNELDVQVFNDAEAVSQMTERKANIDGYYSDMSVGLAENLISPDGVVDEEPYQYRTTAGSQSVTDGFADLRAIKGNTLVWNQHAYRYNSEVTAVVNGITFTRNADSTITIDGTSTDYAWMSSKIPYAVSAKVRVGHKYFYSLNNPNIPKNSIQIGDSARGARSITSGDSVILTFGEGSGFGGFQIGVNKECTVNNLKVLPMLVDLTQLFGAGNEPNSTDDARITWLESELSKHPDRIEGTLLNVDVDGIKTVGFNLTDFSDSYIVINTYRFIDLPIGETNPLHVTITDKDTSVDVNNIYFGFTRSEDPDSEGYNWIVSNGEVTNSAIKMSNRTFIPESKRGRLCGKIIVYPSSEDVFERLLRRYNICIHIEWSGYRNGEYEPYWTQTRQLPPIKDIVDADGNQLFPYGLLSAGDVRDEITPTKAIKRVGVVDLGTVRWSKNSSYYNSSYSVPIDGVKNTLSSSVRNILCAKYPTISVNSIIAGNFGIAYYTYENVNYLHLPLSEAEDSAKLKEKLNGVMLYYELETPIEVEFDEPYNFAYKISDFGTEEFISSAEMTAPVAHETFYMQNLRDDIRRLPTEYQSQDSMNNLCAALGQAFGCTITANWDAATKAYTYTVSMNGQTLEVDANE